MNGFRLKTFTVTEVTDRIYKLLSSDPVLRRISVIGEASNCSKRYENGTVYFLLKDEGASIKVFYRGDGQVRDGMKLRATGNISLYRARGEYQLYAEMLEEQGRGDLHARFARLKAELDRKGYFAPERKRALPARIGSVGVITSLNGAAITDILSVFRRRDAVHRSMLYDARVQGIGAAEQIARAIRYFGSECPVDVLLVSRGGGSIEDLWAFNELAVVEAIRASRIPVISAVGHEVDVTLSDLVADYRAATPTAAAERICDATARGRYAAELRAASAQLRTNLDRLLDQLRRRVLRAEPHASEQLLRSLVRQRRTRLNDLKRSTADAVGSSAAALRAALALRAAELDALSPLRTIDRGYAVVLDARPLEKYREGDLIDIRLREGELSAKVTDVRPASAE